jgi:signal transduction histidine kinase
MNSEKQLIDVDGFAARRQRYIVGLLIRVVTCVIFIIVFAVTASLVPPSARRPFVPASLVLGLLILINYPFWLVGKTRQFPIKDFYAHWVIDLFLVTLIVHTLGGVDLPGGFGGYLTMIVTSAVFMSDEEGAGLRAALIVATSSTVLFDALVIMEGVGILPHQTAVWSHHYTTAAQVIILLAANVFFYFFAFLVGSLSKQLKAANTELIKARDDLAKSNQDLEQRVKFRTEALEQKTREIEEFVHIVTHDLRNTSVGVAELARRLIEVDGGVLSERGLRYATNLKIDIRSLNEMLSHLLALFRVDYTGAENGSVDTLDLVHSILNDNARRIHEKHININIGPLPTIVADSLQLRHVITNLLDNAIKYTGDKPTPTIFIGCADEAMHYRFAVKDNGIGIPENQKNRVFQLYQRGTDQLVGGVSQEGAGIGLAIAKRIVERWGGSVGVISTHGAGSEFYFTIPKVTAGAA